MAAGDLITGEWELEYRGLLLGGDTAYPLAQIEGLADLPEVRFGDRPLLRRHGLRPGSDFLGGRELVLTFDVDAASDADLATKVADLSEAFRPLSDIEEPLVLQVPGIASGNKSRVYCRPRGRVAVIGLDWLYHLPQVVIRLQASDPRIYANLESSGTTSMLTAGGGLEFPLVFPAVFGAMAEGGTIQATNSGTFPTDWVAVIQGPATNPRVERQDTGEFVSVSISLGAADYLVLDSERRTVMLNGTASRYHLLDPNSTWFNLDPGTSPVRFLATTPTAASMSLTWRSAWV